MKLSKDSFNVTIALVGILLYKESYTFPSLHEGTVGEVKNHKVVRYGNTT